MMLQVLQSGKMLEPAIISLISDYVPLHHLLSSCRGALAGGDAVERTQGNPAMEVGFHLAWQVGPLEPGAGAQWVITDDTQEPRWMRVRVPSGAPPWPPAYFLHLLPKSMKCVC